MKKIWLAPLAIALALTSGVVGAQSNSGERPGVPREFGVESEQGADSVWVWRRSTDDTGIREYRFYDNGQPLLTVGPSERSAELSLGDGNRYIQMDAVDLDGNQSVKTAPIMVKVDNTGPSAPVGVTVEASYIRATTRVLIRFQLPNPDDVSSCTLLRNLGPSLTGDFDPAPDPNDPTQFLLIEWSPPSGDAWFQVVCEDGTGNRSVRSAPAFVNILQF